MVAHRDSGGAECAVASSFGSRTILVKGMDAGFCFRKKETVCRRGPSSPSSCTPGLRLTGESLVTILGVLNFSSFLFFVLVTPRGVWNS